MRSKAFVLAATLAVLAPVAALAGTPTPVQITCPVGGKVFTFITTSSVSTWGTRPDGKPYTSWISPMPMSVCPDNGLVIYKDFSEEEIARLGPLIRNPAYLALRDDTPRYRAAWLLRNMDKDKVFSYLWLLNQASWEADGDPERKSRYKREFAEAVAASPPQPKNGMWISMQVHAANAWRELGDLDRAQATLAALPLASLETALEATKNGTGQDAGATPENLETVQNLVDFAKSIGEIIKRGETSSEPLPNIPLRVAAQKCRAMQKTPSGSIDDFCKSATIQARIKLMGED